MLTVSKLARRCGLSRSTLLYYESIGLLKPAPRTSANYRRYGEKELERLQQVCVYREAGLKLLQCRALERIEMMTKQKWVSIMKAAGFAEADMDRWHTEFERSAPAEHQEFLEFLHIPADEIRAIRESSRKGG